MLKALLIWLAALQPAEAPTPAEPDARLHAVAVELFPQAPADDLILEPAALPGYFRLSFGTQIFYLSEDARYLIAGPLYDLQTKENLTAARQAEARRALLESAELETPIIFPAKAREQRSRVAVVTNINCTFCRQLHRQLDEYLEAGMEIQYVMLPAGGGTGYEQTAALICDADPATAISSAMLGGPTNAKADITDACRRSLDEHVALARKLGAVSTPNLVLPSGELIQGYQSPAQLKARLGNGTKR